MSSIPPPADSGDEAVSPASSPTEAVGPDRGREEVQALIDTELAALLTELGLEELIDDIADVTVLRPAQDEPPE